MTPTNHTVAVYGLFLIAANSDDDPYPCRFPKASTRPEWFVTNERKMSPRFPQKEGELSCSAASGFSAFQLSPNLKPRWKLCMFSFLGENHLSEGYHVARSLFSTLGRAWLFRLLPTVPGGQVLHWWTQTSHWDLSCSWYYRCAVSAIRWRLSAQRNT